MQGKIIRHLALKNNENKTSDKLQAQINSKSQINAAFTRPSLK